MGISEAIKIIKEIGVQRFFEIVSSVAGFFLPFIVWIIIFQLAGQAFFLINWAIPGLIILVFVSVLFIPQIRYIRSYEFRLMKRIEYARDIFDNPADPNSEKRYIAECERFILPYIYKGSLVLSGFTSFTRIPTWRRTIFELPIVYISYSFVSLLVLYKDSISSIYLWLVSTIQFPQFFSGTLQDWTVLLFFVWIISIYKDLIISSLRLLNNPLTFIPSYCLSLFNVHFRIIMLIEAILGAPAIIREHRLSCKYKPFVDPLTLPTIVQRAVQNVEGKSCNVSRWSREFKEEEDIEDLKNMLLQVPSMPSIVKVFVKRCDAKDTMNRINTEKPVLYLGTVANQCVFLGNISYDPNERVRIALFYFDTIYIKREFILIMEKETEKQRVLRKELPVPLEEVIKKIEGT